MNPKQGWWPKNYVGRGQATHIRDLETHLEDVSRTLSYIEQKNPDVLMRMSKDVECTSNITWWYVFKSFLLRQA